MSFVKFFPYNYIDDADVVLTPSSEDAFFPAANLKDYRSTKEFRTQSGTTSLELVIDLQTTESIDSFLVRGGLFNGFGFTGDLTLEASATSNFSSPPFTTTLTPNLEYNVGVKTFPSESYRYWRISCSAPGADYASLANVYLGSSVGLTTNNIEFGWQLSAQDQSDITSNPYGQPFINKRNVLRELRASFTLLNKDELTELDDMFRVLNETEPVWFYVFDPQDQTVVNDAEIFLIQGLLRDIPSYRNTNFGLFETQFRIREIP